MNSQLLAKEMQHSAQAAPSEGGSHSNDHAYAVSLDEKDPLRSFRSEFIIPTKQDLKRKSISRPTETSSEEESVYLCGNSLGLQPRQTSSLISSFLSAWSTKAVTGHFIGHDDAPNVPPFLHVDDYAAELMAPIVGAKKDEVACMGTLTGNLHLMMSSFYRPELKQVNDQGVPQGRYKIILEGKAFPSDHFAIESQIRYHNHDPNEAMILIAPEEGSFTLSTSQILSTIDSHADTTALLLLPGIQFYTGQYFDIPRITAHAQSKGILVGWDLAHAVGNLPLYLHDWNVDFAVWCTYKYLNAGPGAIAGAFVHQNHGKVQMDSPEQSSKYRPRLAGWWGANKETRFAMDNNFHPRPGAAGYQLSNPSALDLTSVTSSLLIFNRVPNIMEGLRSKSLKLTFYLETLLLSSSPPDLRQEFEIITPFDPSQRGAQLSVRLRKREYLDTILEILEREGVIVDERKPDVIRVAPAPLYNGFEDCWKFSNVFLKGLESVVGHDHGEGKEVGSVIREEKSQEEEKGGEGGKGAVLNT